MSYKEIWKIMDDSLKDLRKTEGPVPTEVIKDLHSAKTFLEILKIEPSHLEIIPQIENYLGSVEAYIFYTTQDRLGQEYVDAFMEKIKKAREKLNKKEIVVKFAPTSFVAGLPRGKPWMRIRVSNELPKKKIESLAKDDGLSFKLQKDNYLMVYGDKEKIKIFVKKLAGQVKTNRNLTNQLIQK